MMDAPDKVVDAVFNAAVHPRQEIAVGWKGKAAQGSEHVSRFVTERLTGNVTQRVQIQDAPPAPHTAGNLFEPMDRGTDVDGGVRQRVAVEDQRKPKQR
jgi:hypothetical protein